MFILTARFNSDFEFFCREVADTGRGESERERESTYFLINSSNAVMAQTLSELSKSPTWTSETPILKPSPVVSHNTH